MHVRARSGFFVQKTDSNPASEEQLRKQEISLAMASPLDFTGVAVTAALGNETPATTDGKKKVPFKLELPANSITVDAADNNHVVLDFFAIARDPAGKTVAQVGQTVVAHLKPETLVKVQQSGTTYSNVLELAPGEYSVRFVVRDVLSGRIGTVSAPLRVE
jgi:hypothetical protein